MDFNNIVKRLKEKFAELELNVEDSQAGDPFLWVPAGKIIEILTFLRDDVDLAFDCLSNLTGVDAPPDDLDVVYHLFSYDKHHSLTLKIRVAKSQPEVQTAEQLYPTANWQEREAYDLLGVVFKGHSDLRRIMLPDDWEGHPLRKDYQEAEEYRGIDTTRPNLLEM